jgi:hypothetical protein
MQAAALPESTLAALRDLAATMQAAALPESTLAALRDLAATWRDVTLSQSYAAEQLLPDNGEDDANPDNSQDKPEQSGDDSGEAEV